MQLSTTFRHMEASPAVKDYAEERLEKIKKYFSRDPIAAHGNYDSDERVIELITQGNTEIEKNELLSRRCRSRRHRARRARWG